MINIGAVVVLLAYMQTLSFLAGVAADTVPIGGDLAELRTSSVVVHSVLALLLLLVATVLAVYKPKGMTPYGWRKQQERRTKSQPANALR